MEYNHDYIFKKPIQENKTWKHTSDIKRAFVVR